MSFPLIEDGNISKMSVACQSNEGSDSLDLFFAAYREDSADANSHDLIASAESLDVTVSKDALTWYDINFASELLIADDYILATLGNGADLTTANNVVYLYGDFVGGSQRYYLESSAGGTAYATRKAEDPWTNADSATSNKYSIYATYSAEEPPSTVEPVMEIIIIE